MANQNKRKPLDAGKYRSRQKRKGIIDSRSKNKADGKIIRLYPDSWLIETDGRNVERVFVNRSSPIRGHFSIGDSVQAELSPNRLLENLHVKNQRVRYELRPAAVPMRVWPGAERPVLTPAVPRFAGPPLFYDGMPINCETNTKGELTHATATDISGVRRELIIWRSWVPTWDPTARLTYLENGVTRYFAQLVMSRDFRATLTYADDVRSLTVDLSVGVENRQTPFVELWGRIYQNYGAVLESWFLGRYQNGLIDVDISPLTYFTPAIERASYFAVLVKEPLPTKDDPLNDPKNQQILKSFTFGQREWQVVAVGVMLSVIQRVGCAAWMVWPWGTLLCGAVTITTVVGGALAASNYFSPAQPTPTPPPPPPPPTVVTPTPGSSSPFPPIYPDCQGQCTQDQVCMAGRCVDIAGPTGIWGPGGDYPP